MQTQNNARFLQKIDILLDTSFLNDPLVDDPVNFSASTLTLSEELFDDFVSYNFITGITL